MSSPEKTHHYSMSSISKNRKYERPSLQRHQSEGILQPSQQLKLQENGKRVQLMRSSSSGSTSEYLEEVSDSWKDSPNSVFDSPAECELTMPYSFETYPDAESRFQDAVERHAREVAGERQDPIELDKAICKVKLELSSEQGMPLPNTIGQRAQERLMREPRGDVKMEDIFKLAKDNATNEAKHKRLNKDAFNRYIWEHGNRVLITGQAGIGKSTLTRDIVQKILDKQIQPETRYIFYIKCRDIDFEEKLDLLDFLLKYSVSDNVGFNQDERNFMLKLIDTTEHAIIFFDGMDEARTNDLSMSAPPKCLAKDVVQNSVIIRCLMSGKLFPKAKVVVTCRPKQAYKFSPEYRPGAVVQIMGLNEESQKQLGKQICGQKDFQITYNMIHRDPDLESVCYISVFCMILYAVLHEANMNQSRVKRLLLNTITKILIYLLDKYLRSDHMRNVATEDMRKIAELARKGFTDKKLVFDEEDFAAVGTSSSAFQAFMVTYVDKDTKLRYRVFDREQKCSFSHQIWQEFFSAIDLMFFAPVDVFEKCLENITNSYSRWETVGKFMFGLTNPDNINFIQRYFLPRTFNPDWEKRKKHLRTSAECCIRQRQNSQDCHSLVQVCNWIHEADDYSFSCRVAKRLPESFKLLGADENLVLFHQDVQSIVRLLYAASDFIGENPVKNIDFENIEFIGESFRNFASHLSRIKGTLHEVRLNNCVLGNSAGNQLTRFMHKTTRLHISYCNLSPAEVSLMKEQYEKLPEPRPEVWVFDENTTPCDFGQDLRQKLGGWKRSLPVQHG